jgi:hypothetical protein
MLNSMINRREIDQDVHQYLIQSALALFSARGLDAGFSLG